MHGIWPKWLIVLYRFQKPLPLQEYEAGRLLSGDLKKELISVLQAMVTEHQEKRKTVTDDMVRTFMTQRPLNFKLAS